MLLFVLCIYSEVAQGFCSTAANTRGAHTGVQGSITIQES